MPGERSYVRAISPGRWDGTGARMDEPSAGAATVNGHLERLDDEP